jgi:hypothetical protein
MVVCGAVTFILCCALVLAGFLAGRGYQWVRDARQTMGGRWRNAG